MTHLQPMRTPRRHASHASLMETFEREEPLAPLPRPVYFVISPGDQFADLVDQSGGVGGSVGLLPSAIEISDRLTLAMWIWVVQAYVQLKRRGLDVHLTTRLVPGEINVTAYDRVTHRERAWPSFIVCVQHDRPRPMICDMRIVQNRACVEDDQRDVFIPHWPQPGLRPRDVSRGETIGTIAYKGLQENLADRFRTPDFVRRLRAAGVELSTCDRTPDQTHGVDWTDYHDADLVLAVRDLPEAKLRTKPATKLVNAWVAGCPALLGPEVAYAEERRSPLDFIEVTSPDDVLAAIERLRSTPALYREMVENGRARAQAFAPQHLAECWRDALAGPVFDAFEHWQRRGRVWDWARFAGRVVQHRIEIRRFLRPDAVSSAPTTVR